MELLASTPRELRFSVPGQVIAQGSKTAKIVGRRVSYGSAKAVVNPRVVLVELADMGKKNRPSGALSRWRKSVAQRALAERVAAGLPVLSGPVELNAEFVIARPPSHYTKASGRLTKSAPAHPGLPDLSKLVRAIEDAMTGVVYEDDRQIVKLAASKRYASKGRKGGVIIAVRETTC